MMRFLIINLTDKNIPITRTSMEKVILPSHKPYLLETAHNPEINFWRNCTDIRFRVISNSVEIDRYMQVLNNQSKNNTSVSTPTEVEITNEESDAETNSVPDDVAGSVNDVNTEETTEYTEETTKYTEEQLINFKVAELKALASELNITLPSNANKATIIQTIIDNQ